MKLDTQLLHEHMYNILKHGINSSILWPLVKRHHVFIIQARMTRFIINFVFSISSMSVSQFGQEIKGRQQILIASDKISTATSSTILVQMTCKFTTELSHDCRPLHLLNKCIEQINEWMWQITEITAFGPKEQ